MKGIKNLAAIVSLCAVLGVLGSGAGLATQPEAALAWIAALVLAALLLATSFLLAMMAGNEQRRIDKFIAG